MSEQQPPAPHQKELDEMELRHVRVMELYSKGMTQAEIAERLGLRQSTISKDLKKIRGRMAKEVKGMVSDQVWEFVRHLAGTDTALKKMWEIADDPEVPAKTRVDALALIMDFYDSRGVQTMIGIKCVQSDERTKERRMSGR